jgi:hypothetical protein
MLHARIVAAAIVAAALAGLSSPASAHLSFSIEGDPGSRYIVVSGEFEYGDSLFDLSRLAPQASARMVTFDSPGGNLSKAMELGRLILQLGLSTAQIRFTECASACAFAFLGGVTRLAEPGSIGVHKASFGDDAGSDVGGAVRSIQDMTAIEIAYLEEMGVDPGLLELALSYDADDIRYLSGSEMAHYHVTTSSLDADTHVAVSPPPAAGAAAPFPTSPSYSAGRYAPSTPDEAPGSAPAIASADWLAYGDWIQIYSRENSSDAVAVAESYRGTLPNVLVFAYTNGWFAGVVGPFRPGMASGERDRLKSTGQIPADSFVVRGDRFVQLIDGTPPARPLLASQPSGEMAANAIAAAQRFETALSLPNDALLDYLSSVYAPTIDYFGKPTARVDVLRDKQAFVSRWTERAYVIEPGSVRVGCWTSAVCVVRGIVDWTVANAARGATSTGAAAFELTFRMTGFVTLTSEWSAVMSRHMENTAELPR